MKKLKTIYNVSTVKCGEMDLFFDAKFKLITWWSNNDAMFRHEYMKDLFEHMGYKVEFLQDDDERIQGQLKKVFEDCGYSEDDC